MIPGSIRSPGEGYPLQYSCLENPINRGAWWITVHGVAKSWTYLSDNHTHTHTHTHTHRDSRSWFRQQLRSPNSSTVDQCPIRLLSQVATHTRFWNHDSHSLSFQVCRWSGFPTFTTFWLPHHILFLFKVAHSSVRPGRLQSIRSQRVGHDSVSKTTTIPL